MGTRVNFALGAVALALLCSCASNPAESETESPRSRSKEAGRSPPENSTKQATRPKKSKAPSIVMRGSGRKKPKSRSRRSAVDEQRVQEARALARRERRTPPAGESSAREQHPPDSKRLKEVDAALTLKGGRDLRLQIQRVALLVEAKRHREAVLECDRILEFDPRNGEAYWWRGGVGLEHGDRKRALQDLRKAVIYLPRGDHRVKNAEELLEAYGVRVN